MRHLIEIYLSGWEWYQHRRGIASARAESREAEKKGILTFLSQGASGGVIGYFLTTVCGAVLYFDGNGMLPYVLFALLPIILAVGAFCGALTGIFVWLFSVLLKRRIGFVARAFITAGVMFLLGFAISFWLRAQPSSDWSVWSLAGFTCVMYLPIVLMTGFQLRPGRVMAFGSGGIPRRSLRAWFAAPPGFLLRAASIFGVMESLLVLAVWISAQMSLSSSSFPLDSLAAIILATLYFGASAYFSFKTPRKMFLLPIAIALNLPAVLMMVSEKQFNTMDSNFLAYLYLGFICLWILYSFACLIAPAPASRIVKLVNGTYVIKTYSNATL